MADIRDFVFRDNRAPVNCTEDFVQRDNGPFFATFPPAAHLVLECPYTFGSFQCGESEFDWWVTPDGDAWTTPDGDEWEAIPDP